MRKIISFSLIFLFIFPTLVSADGMIHIEDPDMQYWRLYDENQQLCAINYQNGFEKMILAVDIGDINKDQKGVWIFPVPASPDRTVIDVIKGFPNLWGSNVESELKQTLDNIFSVMRLTQIYTFPFFLFRYFGLGTSGRTLAAGDSSGITTGGVTVHEYIQKYGITTELVSARSGEDLYKHLTGKGLNLPEESKGVINEYVGQDYSFVISWLSGDQVYDSYNQSYKPSAYDYSDVYNTVSVSLTFPTDKIYYPLKPTSVYGSKKVPALIYVVGYVTPNLYPEIKMDSEVTYFVGDSQYVPQELQSFFGGGENLRNFKYTKIKINPPSKYLTKDLWIENVTPNRILVKAFIIENSLAIGIIFFALSSSLASMLAALIMFNKDKPPLIKFSLFGLWNCLTIIGFSIATIFIKTKKIEPELESKIESRGLKVWDVRKIPFVILFSILFLVITFLFQLILKFIF